MSTLAVVEAILREAAMPLSVREIVERAGDALPTKSKTPDTVVARDLSMDIKRKGEVSTFARTSPGRYSIRVRASAQQDDRVQEIADASSSGSGQPFSQPVTITPASSTPLAASGMATIGGPPAAAAPGIADSAGAPASLVGQSLPHDRNGTRPAPGKPQSNSEDTPMSA